MIIYIIIRANRPTFRANGPLTNNQYDTNNKEADIIDNINKKTDVTDTKAITADFLKLVRTERAENHKDQQYCQVCRSGCPKKKFVCVFCFAPEIGNATGMPERSRSTRN